MKTQNSTRTIASGLLVQVFRAVDFGTALACSLLLASVWVAPLQAQIPPPGAIFDLATTSQHTGVLTSYQQFSTSFVAAPNTTSTTVSFAFREIPAYFAIDDTWVSNVTTSGGNLLLDPGFETAVVDQNVPFQWHRWIQPIDVTAIGVVASLYSNNGCPPNASHGGQNFWCDGSVQGYDAIYQTIATTPGDTYKVTFWLGDNSNKVPKNPGIDMLVYATQGLPEGTQSITPEPGTLALFGSGVLGLCGVLRRRLRG